MGQQQQEESFKHKQCWCLAVGTPIEDLSRAILDYPCEFDWDL